MELTEYRSKRDFDRTPEPGLQAEPVQSGPLRFVVGAALHPGERQEIDRVFGLGYAAASPTAA